MSNKIIAIDYDGTIALNSFPHAGEPNWPVIEKAKVEQANGARLILWTCRDGDELTIALKACADWGLSFEAVNDNPVDRQLKWNSNPRKIYADEYWDDHAVNITHAKWQKQWCDSSMIGHMYEECPICDCMILDTEKFWDCKFCPNCGTEMPEDTK